MLGLPAVKFDLATFQASADGIRWLRSSRPRRSSSTRWRTASSRAWNVSNFISFIWNLGVFLGNLLKIANMFLEAKCSLEVTPYFSRVVNLDIIWSCRRTRLNLRWIKARLWLKGPGWILRFAVNKSRIAKPEKKAWRLLVKFLSWVGVGRSSDWMCHPSSPVF